MRRAAWLVAFLLAVALVVFAVSRLERNPDEGLAGWAGLHVREGRHQEAIDFLTPRLAEVQEGKETRLEAEAFFVLGVAQRSAGAREDAERSLTRALAALERIEPDVVEPVLDQLGLVALERGDLATAEERLTRAWALNRRTGSAYPSTPSNLATVRVIQGSHGAAIVLLEEAIRSAERSEEESDRVPQFRRNLIDALRLAGKEAEAKRRESEWAMTGSPQLAPK